MKEQKKPDNLNQLESALNALNAGVWKWIENSDIILWSSRCYDLFNLPPGPVKNDFWLNKIYPDDQDRTRKMWKRVPYNEGWFEMEFRVPVESELHWIRMSGYFIPATNDMPGYASGAMIDFTEQGHDSDELFKATERIRQSENNLDTIFNLLEDAVMLSDNQGNILKANSLFTSVFSYNSQKENNFFNLLPRSASVIMMDSFDKVILNNKPDYTRCYIHRRLFENKIFPVPGGNNTVERIAVYCHDVTDIESSRESLRQSEEKFRLIAENVNDIIIILSVTDGIEYISPGITVNLGYDPDSIIGKEWRSFVVDEDIPIIENIYKKLNAGTRPELVEFRIIDNKGNPVWFETMFQKQRSGNKKSSGKIISVSREIQDRKIAEEKQKQIEKQLNDANLTKDKFFSIIAHDLRSPFTSILGFSRLLNEEYDDFSDEERKMMIKQILTSTESTFQLLDNLLAWAKTQLGLTSFNPEFFDIETLIIETLNLTIPQAKIKGLTLKALMIEKTQVFADVNMIRTVLRNLLSNAIKFSFEGGSITVEASRNHEKIRVCISDTGTGIEPKTLKALFKLDEKVCSTKGTANEKGSGLGLILCKEFIETNGGKIWVESKVNEGSKFCFTVPLK